MSSPLEDTTVLASTKPAPNTLFQREHVPTRLKTGSLTHIGMKRKQNQDHYAVIQRRREQEVIQSDLPMEDFPSTEDVAYLMIVADGIGGSEFGELASRLVIQKIWELGEQAASWVMRLSDIDTQQYEERARAYAAAIQNFLASESENATLRLDMGTTATSAYIVGRDAIIAHVGDSRAYLLRDNELRQITEDQTMAQKMLKLGYDEESVTDFHRILANYFGTGMSGVPEVEMQHIELQEDDRLLLCTDGLFKELNDGQLRDQLSASQDPQTICDTMLKAALDSGGRDNITMILAEIDHENCE